MEVVNDERWRSVWWISEVRDERAVRQGDESKTVQVDERVVRPRKRGRGADDALVDELIRSDAREARSGESDRAPNERDEAVWHFLQHECASARTKKGC